MYTSISNINDDIYQLLEILLFSDWFDVILSRNVNDIVVFTKNLLAFFFTYALLS